MATPKANTILQPNTKTTIEPARPLANFPPSIWGDRFLSFSLDNSQYEAYGKAMEEPKEQVRRLILDSTIDSNQKLSLIYSVFRLGLTYVFLKDIEAQLDTLFNQLNLQEDYNEADLYTTSIHFQVFRLFGYRFSCDVFNKFKDFSLGVFKEDIVTKDVRGMLSFYESAQLRIRGESILDEAATFTEAKLKTIDTTTLEASLARQVKQALVRPFHRGHQMVEARYYLILFKEEISRYDSLLTLAKLHFNYLQLLQKEELGIVSRWWRELELQMKTSYVRDRVAELYVWMLSLFSFEPYYSQARIITTKIVTFVLVLDDTYDAYATIEELRLLTHAINRWDITAMSQLPEYIKPFYGILLKEYAGFNKQLPQQETTNLTMEVAVKAFQELAGGYHQESEWRDSGEMPSYEEYMKTGLITSTHDCLSKSALIGMGKIVTQEALAWYQSYPTIKRATQLVGRLTDDVVSVEFERERGQMVTSVDTYKKTFGVSENVAVEALNEIVQDGWKDINEGCLKPMEVPVDLLAPILNLARMTDVAYRYNDGLTFPERTLKEYITLLFCSPVDM